MKSKLVRESLEESPWIITPEKLVKISKKASELWSRGFNHLYQSGPVLVYGEEYDGIEDYLYDDNQEIGEFNGAWFEMDPDEYEDLDILFPLDNNGQVGSVTNVEANSLDPEGLQATYDLYEKFIQWTQDIIDNAKFI